LIISTLGKHHSVPQRRGIRSGSSIQRLPVLSPIGRLPQPLRLILSGRQSGNGLIPTLEAQRSMLLGSTAARSLTASTWAVPSRSRKGCFIFRKKTGRNCFSSMQSCLHKSFNASVWPQRAAYKMGEQPALSGSARSNLHTSLSRPGFRIISTESTAARCCSP
jgi:hypothetical protein